MTFHKQRWSIYLQALFMTAEVGPEAPITEHPDSFPRSGVIFDVTDPRTAELNREERVRLYYATELADGNLDALARRYRIPNEGSDQEPWRDILVADPLSDLQIGVLASMIRTARSKSGEQKQES